MQNATAQATRISRVFARLKQENRSGLIAYLTAGDPTPEHTPGLVAALARGGADIIELGVPFSDPIADGPVIQRASDRALKSGTTLQRVLEIAATIRKTSDIPLLLFTYLNPLLKYGLERLAKDAVASGIDGCLLTDLSVEEADKYVGVMRSSGLDTVFLAAPTSTGRRLELVARYSSGFVYLVSRTGVTGEQTSVSDAVGPLVQAMRSATPLPLAVGFGIATAAHAAQVGAVADAVVVGSAIVRLIEQNAGSPDLEFKLESLVRELSSGLGSRNK
ncbi:MAG TPA: tryptophan synthase subunit alpha [Bryobacteraceae bacterium]|nr:tryptophan synthase subunit alpha [Bryobacteraceae bacterium]